MVTDADNEFSSEIINVSPSMAARWLDDSTFDNRRVEDRNVAKIASDIRKGNWIFDGNPIRFDKDNNVIDGQHRLKAIIRANKSVKSTIIRGLDIKAKDTIDTGKPRSVSDVLHFNGHVNNAMLASVCRLAIGYDECRGNMMEWAKAHSRIRYSTQEILHKVQIDKETVHAVSAILPLKFVRKFLGGSTAAFCYYVLRRSLKENKHLVDAFFLAFEKGENLNTGDIILLLRNTLSIRDMRDYYTKGGNLMMAYRLALVIKAWNAWKNKTNLVQLKFDDDKEKFPLPL